MIKVDIEKLETVISEYSKLIERYENISATIEHEYNFIKENWQSTKMNKFYKEIDEEQIENKKLLLSMKEYLDVLRSIASHYKELGMKIECNLNSKEIILKNLNITLQDINNIIKRTSYLASSGKVTNATSLSLEVGNLKSSYSRVENVKVNLDNFYTRIENIETDIHIALNRIEGD